MSCREWESLLAEYVDGALSPEDRARVERHLAGCPTCAAEVAAVQRLAPVLRSLPEAQPPAGLADAVFAVTTRRRGWLRRLLPRRLAPLSAAAAVLVVVVALVTVYRNSEMADRLPALDKGRIEVSAEMPPSASQPVAGPTPKEEAAAEDTRGPAVGALALTPPVKAKLDEHLGPTPARGIGGAGRAGGQAGQSALDTMSFGAGGGAGSPAPPQSQPPARPAPPPPHPPAVVEPSTDLEDEGGRHAEPDARYRNRAAGEEAQDRSLREGPVGGVVQPSEQEADQQAEARAGDETEALQMADELAAAAPVEILHRWEERRCGVNKPRTVLVDSADVWNRLWAEINALRLGPAAAPHVDFTWQAAVGVFLGIKPTGGWAVSVTEARLLDGTLYVTAHVTEPAAGTLVTQALTQPYSLVVIPRAIDGATITHETPVQVIWR
jgi:hypothetical protein